MRNFTKEQQDHIDYFKREWDIDLTKGFLWSIDDLDEEFKEDGEISISITPRDYYEKEGYHFDQHGSAEIMLEYPEYWNDRLGEAAEGAYTFEGTEEEFRELMAVEQPFFMEGAI